MKTRFGGSIRKFWKWAIERWQISTAISITHTYIIIQTNLIHDECFLPPREIFHLKNSIYHWTTDEENIGIVKHNVFLIFLRFFHKYKNLPLVHTWSILEPLSLDCYSNIPHNEFVISLVFVVVVIVIVCSIPTIYIFCWEQSNNFPLF